jgi:hypothetical protein
MKAPKGKEDSKLSPADFNLYFFDKDFTQKPCFCFQYLHKDYNSDNCDDDQIKLLIKTLEKLSNLTWLQIESSHRHGLGSEKISRHSVKPHIPDFIPKDATILSIRFAGNAPMVGFREKNIFHVLFLDGKFNVYNHG